ncbi:FecR domain-containing protein [Lentisphaera marina]|uniref:LamG-like jellyroll fold domain-containing protein n=1 Tax=Lentisphaera marina TaxID=1111041 RepID=UPI002366BC72|nr:LamG-like jellyroll fold domain-containing protein [Lentisphaera marina]MDD7986374.1 FecR domain-containing protein [Lentisphaera marina]
MKELELLIDKCLHGEATKDEEKHLQKLISKSDEAFEFYLQSIQQHSDLKEWADSQEEELVKVHKFPFLQWSFAIAALLITGFVLFTSNQQSPDIILKIHSVSTNFKLIRQGEMISNILAIKQGDQILVGEGGQVRLDVQEQDSQIFLMENSSVNFVNRDCNYINLQQGEIRAKLEKQNSPFIIKTNEGEAEIIGTEFSLSDKGETQLWVSSGKVKLNRGQQDSVLVEAGQRIDTESFRVEEKDGGHIIPNIFQGVEFFYYKSDLQTLTLETDMELIDHGVRSDFNYYSGAYDGYVRAAPTHRSFMSVNPFLMVLKAHYSVPEASVKTLRVKSLRSAHLRVNEKRYDLDKKGQVEVPFKQGFNLLELRTIGGQEKDSGEVLISLEEIDAEGQVSAIQSKDLFYTSTKEVPDLSQDEMQSALTCDLPLRKDFVDRANGIEVSVKGEPIFVNDPEMGAVLELNGKSDFLQHLKADELGLNGPYTVSCRVYFDELMPNNRPDDGIFSTAYKKPVEGNSTLVLLIRRGHPYQAHFGNDTISSQVLKEKRWYDLSFRFNKGVQSIFIDGELVTSSQGHGNLYSKQVLQIGTWGANFMKGRICDVKVFNRPLSIKNISGL